DPGGIPISTAPAAQGEPALAFDGTNYLVAWTDYRNSYAYPDLYGARVSPAGAVLDPNGIAISTAGYDQYSPALAFDGTNYFAAWEGRQSGNWDVFGARISRAGHVFDPGPIASSQTDERNPAAIPGAAGRVAVAYDRVAPEVPYAGVRRVFLRLVD